MWSTRWAASYANVCHAGWSSSLHDRGMLCLSRAEHGLSATLAAFGPKVISKLDKVLGQLPRPETCADPSYVAADTPPPQHPALALAMSTFDTEPQFHNALEVTRQLAPAQSVLHDLEQRTVLDPGSRAKLDLARGLMMWMFDEPATADTLQQAYFEARAAGARATASRAAVHLSMQLLDRSKLEAAALWAQLSITEGAELGNLEVTVPTLIAQASVDIAANKPEHAITLMTREKFGWHSSFRTWVYAIARNACFSHARGVKRRGSTTDSVSALVQEVRTETVVFLRTETKDRLAEIRAALEPDDQALLILRVDRQLPWRDIAQVFEDEGASTEALDKRAAALRKRLNRLKDDLRDQLKG